VVWHGWGSIPGGTSGSDLNGSIKPPAIDARSVTERRVCHLTRPKSSMFHVQHFGICSVVTGSRAAMWREGRGETPGTAPFRAYPLPIALPNPGYSGGFTASQTVESPPAVPGARSGDFTVPQAVESPRPGLCSPIRGSDRATGCRRQSDRGEDIPLIPVPKPSPPPSSDHRASGAGKVQGKRSEAAADQV
jgi:hypothetical protein